MTPEERFCERYYKPFMPDRPFTMLDLGCGNMDRSRYCGFSQCDAVDIVEQNLSIKNVTFHRYGVLEFFDECDLQESLFNIPNTWDVVAAFDFLEHTEKEAAISLIDKMKKYANKIVIITTPDGFAPNAELQAVYFQAHLCGFSEDELRIYGFEVHRMKNARIGIKPWHDRTKTPYPASWDRLLGVWKR